MCLCVCPNRNTVRAVMKHRYGRLGNWLNVATVPTRNSIPGNTWPCNLNFTPLSLFCQAHLPMSMFSALQQPLAVANIPLHCMAYNLHSFGGLSLAQCICLSRWHIRSSAFSEWLSLGCSCTAPEIVLHLSRLFQLHSSKCTFLVVTNFRPSVD